MKTIVSEKGQITIPKKVRDTLAIVPGTVLEVVAEDGRIVAVKRPTTDTFVKWRGKGALPFGDSVDEYLTRIRD